MKIPITRLVLSYSSSRSASRSEYGLPLMSRIGSVASTIPWYRITPSAGEKKYFVFENVGRDGSRKKYCSDSHRSGFCFTSLTSVSSHSARGFAIVPPSGRSTRQKLGVSRNVGRLTPAKPIGRVDAQQSWTCVRGRRCV